MTLKWIMFRCMAAETQVSRLSPHTVVRLAEDTNTAVVARDQLISAVGGIAVIQKLVRSAVEASEEVTQDSSR